MPAAAAASGEDHLQAKVVTFSVSVSYREMSTAGNKHVLSAYYLPYPPLFRSLPLLALSTCILSRKMFQKEAETETERGKQTARQASRAQTARLSSQLTAAPTAPSLLLSFPSIFTCIAICLCLALPCLVSCMCT